MENPEHTGQPQKNFPSSNPHFSDPSFFCIITAVQSEWWENKRQIDVEVYN